MLQQSTYVNRAETVIKHKIQKDSNGKQHILTTSKIRGILSMVNALYNDVQRFREPVLNEYFLGRVQYLKMRMAYECKEKVVKDFIYHAKLIEELDNIGDSKENLLLFCHYVEALVAYHKFYNGRD